MLNTVPVKNKEQIKIYRLKNKEESAGFSSKFLSNISECRPTLIYGQSLLLGMCLYQTSIYWAPTVFHARFQQLQKDRIDPYTHEVYINGARNTINPLTNESEKQ